jgi:hypothetical protein
MDWWVQVSYPPPPTGLFQGPLLTIIRPNNKYRNQTTPYIVILIHYKGVDRYPFTRSVTASIVHKNLMILQPIVITGA